MLRKTRLASAGVALALSAALGVLPAAAASAAPSTVAQAPVAAQQVEPRAIGVSGTDAAGNLFEGSISDLTARTVDGVLELTGTITGDLTTAAGTVPVNETFTTTVDGLLANDACTILTLDLGPLDLDVLGLVINLSEVELDITAVPGAGNLLGNLLCAVAGLLDGSGPLQGIGALLNRLLTGLGL